MSLNFISICLKNSYVQLLIRQRNVEFNCETELKWGYEKVSFGEWNVCLTRAIIIICRKIAYKYTGAFGDRLRFPDNISTGELIDISVEWITKVLNNQALEIILSEDNLNCVINFSAR